MPPDKYRHIIIARPPATEGFITPPAGGGDKSRPPQRERQQHSALLRTKFDQAWALAQGEQAVAHADRHGIYLEFKSDPGAELITKSLDVLSQNIRLLNVRTTTEAESTTYATVYVPNAKKRYFLKKIQAYAEENTPTGLPKNADLINSVADINRALVDSFWVDDPALMPANTAEWCEVWLSSDLSEVRRGFEEILSSQDIETRPGEIVFPERTVKIILVNRAKMERLLLISDDIAEFRLAKETASFWMEMSNQEQALWVADLLGRLDLADDAQVSVCILDTGVNNGHALLAPVLDDADCHTIDQGWGAHDHKGHGTLMAGVVAYGDLKGCLASGDTVTIKHRLESSKIFPPPRHVHDRELWGDVTAQGVSRPEIAAPERIRIFCMAVTSHDIRDQGRPSSWSGALDQLAAGQDDGLKRLFIVSAGNSTSNRPAENYPEAQKLDSVHDPAQAWNALTVGAYTALHRLTDPKLEGFEPVAPPGGLSPFSTTSHEWEPMWPIKPEIVMEGGNLADDGNGFVTCCDDLSVLSTFWKPAEHHFYPTGMTSAATAQTAWFAAQIQARYPEFWPETVRALIVHSAQWSDALRTQFLSDKSKGSYAKLLRIAGYGIPDLGRALYSAANSLTLIAQAELQPYDKKEGRRTMKDMHLYDLPWPREVLQGLPDETHVEMRVTLSYFVEPGPGEIGWRDRYRYPSFGLRFDVNSPGESVADFRRRVNRTARDEVAGYSRTGDPAQFWTFGKARDKGSIHSDIWEGIAQELASCNNIAVFPIVGWWRERDYLGHWDKRARYALVVSIRTPEETVDIYIRRLPIKSALLYLSQSRGRFGRGS